MRVSISNIEPMVPTLGGFLTLRVGSKLLAPGEGAQLSGDLVHEYEDKMECEIDRQISVP